MYITPKFIIEVVCITTALFALSGGDFGSLCHKGRYAAPTEQFCVRYPYTNGGEAIRVERVVVVEEAARVLIPRIVRIATIRRAEAHILRSAYVPIIKTIYDSVYNQILSTRGGDF